MNRLIAKYFFIIPGTLLRGEFLYPHVWRYRNRQELNQNTIHAYQQIRLAKLLKFAEKHSRYYRQVFKDSDFDCGSPFSWENFKKLPTLTKADLSDFSGEIMTWRSKYSYSKTTGGSTGQAVTLKKNPSALARERAATARSYDWAKILIGDRQLRFWGVPIGSLDRYKSRLMDFATNRRRISAFGFDEDRMRHCYEQILNFRPKYLYGYASIIEIFAEYLESSSLAIPGCLESVITTSEILTDQMRLRIKAALKVPVFNEYGCGEVGSIAHECEKQSMHIMSDNLYLELLDENGRPCSSGEIVITDLHNYATPLIRYRVGDFGQLGENSCECGRPFPILANVHGRSYDIIRVPSGKVFHPESVMYIFELLKRENQGIKKFQVVQQSISNITVRLVANPVVRHELESRVSALFHDQISPDILIKFEYTPDIPREKSGKMRLVISQIASDRN